MREAVVIALCGLPGSGKSTLARYLQEHTRWLRLDRDALRAELFATGGYTDADKEYLNREMRDRMRTQLRNGHSVILDGMTFSRACIRQQFEADASSLAADWKLVWLDCPVEIACQRVAGDRNHAATDRTPELVVRIASRFEPPRDGLRLDAQKPAPELVELLLTAIRT